MADRLDEIERTLVANALGPWRISERDASYLLRVARAAERLVETTDGEMMERWAALREALKGEET